MTEETVSGKVYQVTEVDPTDPTTKGKVYQVVNVGGGGGGGTTNYNQLSNKPQINGVTLSGNKTMADLGVNIEETKTATLTSSTQLATNTIFTAGELSSVTLTLPAVDTKFISEIHFTSGATATTFAFPSGNRFDGEDCDNGVFVPVANKRYSIMFFYDGTKVCGLVYGY